MALDLWTEVRYLKGVGPKRAELLRRLGVVRVVDLLYLLPRKYLDRRNTIRIADLRGGEEAVVLGEVMIKGTKRMGQRKAFTLVIGDGSGWMELIWLNLDPRILDRSFRVGDRIIASGKVVRYRGVKQMFHPEYEIIGEAGDPQGRDFGGIIPVYPQTEGLKARFIRKLVDTLLQDSRLQIPETIPEPLRRKHGWMSRRQALRNLHFPRDFRQAEQARATLAYEEMLYFFLNLGEVRREALGEAVPLKRTGTLTDPFLRSLPFELTGAQRRVMAEIEADLARPEAMHRLLQGDVGSGKTLVAVYTMLIAVENGYQAALMAPTEILAEQHFLVLTELLFPLGVQVELLTGGMKRRQRMRALDRIETGAAQVIIGTHALIEEGVRFRNLAVAVVDEQHRFGVLQRGRLLRKGEKTPHFLVMTATPIPRTLALTLYGDLDVSILDEKPPGRAPIRTRWVTEEKRDRVYAWVFQKVQEGQQAYVVAPLIEESEKLDVRAAEEVFEDLRGRAPEGVRIGLIHGRVPQEERRRLMMALRRRELDILVATTVIEVGIDVPSATIMVIEHAERFGLAQLHQLRGRVGRGAERSYCILITPRKLSEDAVERMKAMVATDDGFQIAEVDLRLRGPGELVGTRQHGLPGFRVADLLRDGPIIRKAKADAEAVLARDPQLELPEHEILREGLQQFRRQTALYVG